MIEYINTYCKKSNRTWLQWSASSFLPLSKLDVTQSNEFETSKEVPYISFNTMKRSNDTNFFKETNITPWHTHKT